MSQVLTSLSDALAETVASAGHHVVRVEGRSRLPASGVVWSADGIIVTAHHVLEQDENIQVGLADGQTLAATLAGRDPTTDLAVLRVSATGLATPTWAEPDHLRVGHLALALGRPGKNVRATMGILSALGQSWRTPAGGSLDRYVQSDVTMYPGFSGGPMVAADGQPLGINSSALLRGGVTLTIPAPTVGRVVDTLLAHGRIRRGYLGIGAQPIQLPQATGQQLNQETGLLLVSVETDSPAEKGKLFLGDTILSLDGQPVRHLDDLLGLLGGDRVGTSVPVRILRGGQLQELSVTIGERS
ncbi:MAG: S1C family serine protease [Dehalococcoidia bacterium]